MACVENTTLTVAESEMEEGEIVDELDDLSDISSEEEFLLRQRLEVLENYNNVLERKKAKNYVNESGEYQCKDALLHDLSEISDAEEAYTIPANNKQKKKKVNLNYKERKRKEPHIVKNRVCKKKVHHMKKKVAIKFINESSEESEDEYRNKRRKLANAVAITEPKNDTTSLKARLEKMFGKNQNLESNEKIVNTVVIPMENLTDWSLKAENLIDQKIVNDQEGSLNHKLDKEFDSYICDLIDLCNDDSTGAPPVDNSQDCVDAPLEKLDNNIEDIDNSDEDLELLRQHALKTKMNKPKPINIEQTKQTLSDITADIPGEEEDSDTAELRLICLKSAFLKKAIEMKRKQKLKKRLSQTFHDDFGLDNDNNLLNEIEADNNTDIESVDMDIGSDGEDKLKGAFNNCVLIDEENENIQNDAINIPIAKADEVEDDEDLLRAKLLTSLSKNLPNVINSNDMKPPLSPHIQDNHIKEPEKKSIAAPEHKPLIINIGESDSEGEFEATKNLTKMHLKLSERNDFQQKLDFFLKSTRLEVENETLPDIVQKQPDPSKPPTKFVAKAVRNLPKSEQIEYKNLVKRMAELEKIKQARQSSMDENKILQSKDTLKPRNVSIGNPTDNKSNLDGQIAISRKCIAEESAKILKCKEEGKKLFQKYNIVANELRNISTAIALNKKEQRSFQNRLTKFRLQHQMLLKRSFSDKQTTSNLSPGNLFSTKKILHKLQKENNPTKNEYKNPSILKLVKVSVINDLKEDPVVSSKLSVQVDVTSNTKIVKMSKNVTNDRRIDIAIENTDRNQNVNEIKNSNSQIDENSDDSRKRSKDTGSHKNEETNNDVGDYKSPLEALKADTWLEDPNTFLCPFEVGGNCRDPDCKYLHPKIPSDQ